MIITYSIFIIIILYQWSKKCQVVTTYRIHHKIVFYLLYNNIFNTNSIKNIILQNKIYN